MPTQTDLNFSLSPLVGAERRAHDRRTFRSTAHVLLPGGKTVDVRTFDISVGGLGIIASANPPIGVVIALRVHVPQRSKGVTSIDVHGKVACCVHGAAEGGFRIGLAFSQLPPPAREAIESFCR
jgi:c-di-GMP-binding flagellar brake protein YcgR